MSIDRLFSVVWLVGIVLVILSWVRVVPHSVGWVGAGLTLVSFLARLIGNRKK